MPTAIQRGTLIHATLAAFHDQYPTLNPYGIYCLHTGRLMGNHSVNDIVDLIESMEGDPDERADDLAMRILASCRPSLRWNHLRVTDIAVMRKTHPVETLCYLSNGGAAPRINDDFFAEMIARIELFTTLADAAPEAIECLFYEFYMLEDESLAVEQLSARRMRSWLESVTPEGHAAQRRKRLDAIEAEAEAIREGRIKRPARPLSDRTIKQREHEHRISMATAVLDELFRETATPKVVTAIVPAATSNPRPVGAGFKIKMPGGN